MINRLIILGNGFDLAHGLKTKYSDFIQDYFLKIKSSDWEDDFFKFNSPGYLFNNFNNLKSIISHIEASIGRGSSTFRPSKNFIDFGEGKMIEVKNVFFYKISLQHSIENWVDIENEYFKHLLAILDKKIGNPYAEISTLNSEMDMISNLFEKYLTEKVIHNIDNSNIEDLDKIIHDSPNLENELAIFHREFPIKYSNEMLSSPFKVAHPLGKRFLSTMVLNFNYTSTFYKLYDSHSATIVNIHGSLNDSGNPINLGFGDEMSKRYGEIEDYDKNEYLRLMKSFAYSKTTSYKKLFDFIGSNDFQVYIMGHSCGLSDRTLLNAIFENSNCKSIKVFYHEHVNDDGSKKDNYSDIVMNISRHFNQKTMMCEKIVNKEYCSPLPQK